MSIKRKREAPSQVVMAIREPFTVHQENRDIRSNRQCETWAFAVTRCVVWRVKHCVDAASHCAHPSQPISNLILLQLLTRLRLSLSVSAIYTRPQYPLACSSSCSSFNRAKMLPVPPSRQHPHATSNSSPHAPLHTSSCMTSSLLQTTGQ